MNNFIKIIKIKNKSYLTENINFGSDLINKETTFSCPLSIATSNGVFP